jgi:hypothetical protein
MKLNDTQELQIYADAVNLMGENTYCKCKHCSFVSRQQGGNTEETKYMLCVIKSM